MNSEENQDLRTQLERLPEQIRKYYDTYFSTLRGELARPDLFFEAVPAFLKGYKRVLTLGGKDGVVVAHFPIELEITISDRGSGEILLRFPSEQAAAEDSYEFVAPFDLSVSELLELISGGENIGAGISSEEVPWGYGVAGVFNTPQQAVDPDTGRLAWQAPWTRLAFADFNHLYFWEDTERASEEAWKDVEPYVRGLERKELDEIGAPGDIEEAGVKAGDRGVVLEVFERPSPALLVEYADLEGQTKALVTYSADLESILDVFVDRDFLASRGQIPDRNETVREQIFNFPASSPIVRGRLVTA
jgi:hypothetical protein